MVIDRSTVRRYSDTVTALERKAMAAVANSVRKKLASNDELSIEEIRDYSIAVENAAAKKYGDAAAVMAQGLFSDIMAQEDVSAEPVLYDGPDYDAIERGVRYQIGSLLLGKREKYVEELEELIAYHVRRAANQTTIANVEKVNGDG